ncbi:MAG: NFACT RNA binding domain-containing protein [Ignavibacteria bacterium]|jgi:predicted ribosome quality control (RQC) complex YloA/Tae2 family protein
MFNTYFYLNRAVVELNNKIAGAKVFEIFTQDKNKLYLAIANEEYPFRTLIISTDQNIPYLHIKNEHHRAKKNSPNFFENYFPSTIKRFYIAENDRLIKIEFDRFGLFYSVRGSNTNVYLIDNQNKISFFKSNKRQAPAVLLDEACSINFIDSFNENILNDKSFPEIIFPEIKKIESRITKDIFNEYKSRTENLDEASFKSISSKIINEIYEEKISVYFSEEENKAEFLPVVFNKNTGTENLFDNYNNAISKYISLKYGKENYLTSRKEIENHLNKELLKLSNKLNSLKKRIEEGSKEDLYKKYAELLLANIYQLNEKKASINLEDYTTGETITIKLNEKIPPKKNVDLYFEKSKDEKINYQKSIELYNLAKEKFEEYNRLKGKLDKVEDTKELESLKSKLKIKTTVKAKNNLEENIRYYHYLLENKYHIYIGRDSKSNDLISTKFVKQNDFWFHARGVSGSHVVLRVENKKEVVPKNILKAACSLAAYYSKSKTAKLSPVAYTFGKYVYKKKGMNPGAVNISKETVLIVKPEIPKNCELVEE